MLLVLGLAGCGGSAAQSQPIPSVGPTSTSPTPASPSTPAKPESPFERDAPVKVLRQWAVAAAKDLNARAQSFPRSSTFETAAGRKEFSTQVLGPAIGRYYPGPVPFTPVAVKTSGRTSEVYLCLLDSGFSEDWKTHSQTGKRKVGGIKATLQKGQQGWSIDSWYADPGTDCSGVEVEGMTW